MWDTFWDHTNRTTMQQKLFPNFSTTKTGAPGNKIGEEPQNPCPRFKKYQY